MSGTLTDTDAFVLIGYDLPFGQSTGPGIPIGRVGRRRFSVIRDADGQAMLSPLPSRCKFTRLTREMSARLEAFDYRAHHLFVRDGSEVLTYVASEEAEFFGELLRDKTFLADDLYLRLSLAKVSQSPPVILRALLDCVRYRESRVEEYITRTNDRWYQAERRTILAEFKGMTGLPSTFEEAVSMSRAESSSTPKRGGTFPSPIGWRPGDFGRKTSYPEPPARFPMVARALEETGDPLQALFLEHLAVVESAIAYVGSKNHLSAADVEDFSSSVMLRMVEDDYAVFARFQGRVNLRTYLIIAIQRMLIDHRIRAWGRWRPSAEAKRSGSLAIRLEEMLVRDGYKLDEAYEVLKTNHGLTVTRDELEGLAGRLPVRVPLRLESDDALASVASEDREADELVKESGRQELAARVSRALQSVMSTLEQEDRVILVLRFEDGRTIAEIAATLRLEQKPLYRRVDRLLWKLREGLEAEGIDAKTMRELLESPGLTLEWSRGVDKKRE
jgi:RNA polymerase sigma factor (sigma-70 family)